jgi:hypothetical protein
MLKSLGAANKSVKAGGPAKGGDIKVLTYPEGMSTLC